MTVTNKLVNRFGKGIVGFGIVLGVTVFGLLVWSVVDQLKSGAHVQVPGVDGVTETK